jgi:hypothetical protein
MIGDLELGPGENFEVPHMFRVQFHLQNLKLQTPTNKFSLFKQNMLNLEVWWFEIRAPVKFWGPQIVGGPIPPQILKLQTPTNRFWLYKQKRLNIDV